MDVTLPNGVVLRGVPQGTSKEEVKAKAIRAGLATEADFGAPQGTATLDLTESISRIPGPSSPVTPTPPERRVQNPSAFDVAVQGAMAVPAFAAGARGVQLATQGLRGVAPYTAGFAQAVMPRTGGQLLAEGALGATAAVAGEYAGRQFPEGWQRDVASLAAGTAVAAPYALGRNAFDAWATRGLGGDVTQAGGQAAETLGRAQATAQAQTALRANPNLGPTVLRAQEIEKNTGVNLPMLAAADGDTTISSYLQSQMSRGSNAEFTAALKLQYEAAEAALKKAQRGKAPSMQAVDSYVKRKAQETQVANQQLVERAQQLTTQRQEGLTRIDDRIKELSTISPTARIETGEALSNLIKSKQAAIRAELSPLYKELIETATENGVKLPGQAAVSLRSFVSDEMNRDVFAKFPGLYGMIKREFSSPISASPRLAEKYRFATQAQQPKDIPVTTLDSLKREVNRAIRDTKDENNLRQLYALKREVDTAIDAVDPSFSLPYRELDKVYAQRVGLPFNERGVVSIDRTQFAENAVNKITTPTTFRDVMAVVGDSPEGRRIVEDAFMFKLANDRSIINAQTGELNTTQLNRYLNNPDTRKMLDQLPGLRDNLRTMGSRVDVLKEHRANILTAEKEARVELAENIWTQAYGTRDGIRGVIRNAKSTPEQLDELVRLTANDPMARAGVKAALLDDVITAPGDRMAAFGQNREAFEKVFGRNETKNLEFIVEASQRLRDNPFQFKVNINNITKTKWEEATGSKIETTLGEARNQVMSAPRAIINHFSRFFQGRSSQAEAAEMQKFLSNPKNLAEVASAMAELETKGVTQKFLDFGAKMIKNNLTIYPQGAVGGFVGGMQAPDYEMYEPSDPSLLEGFGAQR
jgi:hypothetical protein